MAKPVTQKRLVPRRFARDFSNQHKVQQQFKSECDINVIVKRAEKGLVPAFMNRKAPAFGDFSEVPSLAEAYDRIAAAEQAFSELPAALRRELGNDPRNIGDLTDEQARRYNLLKTGLPASPEDDQGSGGGRPPGKSEDAPKGKSEAQPKSAKGAPASKQDSQD